MKTVHQAGLILLLAEKLILHMQRMAESRRAQANRYPDFRLILAPAFPTALVLGQWRWEFVTCYSGATAPESHGVPRRLIAKRAAKNSPHFKERERTLGKWTGASMEEVSESVR